jgi:hypothetical protein
MASTWALVFAAISLVVAAVSLGWHIVNAVVLDSPRLKVQVYAQVIPDPAAGTVHKAVVVEALNHGKRPITVHQLLLFTGSSPSRWRRRCHRFPGVKYRDVYRTARPILPTGNLNRDYSDDLPDVVEGGSSVSAYYATADLVATLLARGEEPKRLFGHAHTATRPWWSNPSGVPTLAPGIVEMAETAMEEALEIHRRSAIERSES